jgi:hypothetical protein
MFKTEVVMSEENYSQEELNAFSEKLDRWGGTLPTRERALLHALVAEASAFAEGGEDSKVRRLQHRRHPDTHA